VGPWRMPDETRLTPSQEWLFRAYRQGRRFAYHNHISVLCIHAGTRRHSYLLRSSPDHERAWTWITRGEQGRRELLECVVLEQAARLQAQQNRLRRSFIQGPLGYVRALAVDSLRRLGVHPIAAERFLDGEAKGDWIARVRKFTGEAPEISPGEKLFFGRAAAEPFLGRGWHDAEDGGRWSAASRAEILFSVAPGTADLVLELSGHPLRLPDRTEFALNGSPILSLTVDQQHTVVRLPIFGSGVFWLTISVHSPAVPHDSLDTRTLGFWISWLQIVTADRQNDSGGKPKPKD
jgi:hypothetical protein